MKIKTLLLATIVAAGCSQFAQTSFANGDQAKPSDETHIPGVAAQPDSYFYTGKPYDAYLGGYVFAARVLDPNMGRWTTPDPVGFPDGPNNRIYAPVPTSELDPTGYYVKHNVNYVPQSGDDGSVMNINVIEKPTFTGGGPSDSFSFLFQTAFSIDPIDPSVSGWIVQHIVVNINNEYYYPTSDATQSVPLSSAMFMPKGENPHFYLNYYEAWQVTNGQVEGQGVDRFGSDTWQTTIFGSGWLPSPVDATHEGNFSAIGHDIFHSSDFFDDKTGTNNPMTWSPGDKGGVINSGDLRSIGITEDKSPVSWCTDSGTYNHNLSFSWTE